MLHLSTTIIIITSFNQNNLLLRKCRFTTVKNTCMKHAWVQYFHSIITLQNSFHYVKPIAAAVVDLHNTIKLTMKKCRVIHD